MNGLGGFPGFYDAPFYNLVNELYCADKPIEALAEAKKIGVTETNAIYAEAETRLLGTTWEIFPWLKLEAIESEVGDRLEQLQARIKSVCESISKRFGSNNSKPTLISILPADVEDNWMTARWGYYLQREPCHKICIPYHLLSNPDQFSITLSHEFMHDVTTSLIDEGPPHRSIYVGIRPNGVMTSTSLKKAPHWLQEALSTYVEGRTSNQARALFKSGKLQWKEPMQLEGVFNEDSRRPELQEAISAAYSQANLLGLYLATLGTDLKIAAFLRLIGSESVLLNLESEIFAKDRVDIPMRKTYGFTEKEFCADALKWVQTRPANSKPSS